MHNDLSDFAEQIKSLTDPKVVATGFLAFGFSQGAVAGNTFFGSDLESHCVSTYPESWLQHLTKVSSYSNDHLCWDVRRGRSTMIKSGRDICPNNPDATKRGIERAQEVFDLFGARTCVTFPMPSQDNTYSGGGMGLSFSDDARRFELRLAETGGMLGVAAFLAHSRMLLLRKSNDKQPNPLSTREREVLLRMSQGKQIAAIADNLGISVSAVNLYLSNLKKKLQSKTREQALAKAIVAGWIDP